MYHHQFKSLSALKNMRAAGYFSGTNNIQRHKFTTTKLWRSGVATSFERGRRCEAQIRRTGLPTLSQRFRTRADAWAALQEASVVQGGFADQRQIEQMTFDDQLARYALDVTPGKKGRVAEVHQVRLIRYAPITRVRLSDLSAPRIADWRDLRLKKVSGVGQHLRFGVIRLHGGLGHNL